MSILVTIKSDLEENLQAVKKASQMMASQEEEKVVEGMVSSICRDVESTNEIDTFLGNNGFDASSDMRAIKQAYKHTKPGDKPVNLKSVDLMLASESLLHIGKALGVKDIE